ncbi:MAG: hypothetical protein LC797_06705 [Chloroflexi bacterium]|nr:hypothetical protein [Chloroflexota bacterium]
MSFCSITTQRFCFAQIARIVTINKLPAVTTEVVTLARERLVDAPP